LVKDERRCKQKPPHESDLDVVEEHFRQASVNERAVRGQFDFERPGQGTKEGFRKDIADDETDPGCYGTGDEPFSQSLEKVY
jgi:hypothetical protein